MAWAVCSAWLTPSSMRAWVSRMVWLASAISRWMALIIPPISWVALAVRSASLRTSSATTAKPGLARQRGWAASMAAFSAKMVCSAISLITATIWPIWLERAPRPLSAPASWPTVSAARAMAGGGFHTAGQLARQIASAPRFVAPTLRAAAAMRAMLAEVSATLLFTRWAACACCSEVLRHAGGVVHQVQQVGVQRLAVLFDLGEHIAQAIDKAVERGGGAADFVMAADRQAAGGRPGRATARPWRRPCAAADGGAAHNPGGQRQHGDKAQRAGDQGVAHHGQRVGGQLVGIHRYCHRPRRHGFAQLNRRQHHPAAVVAAPAVALALAQRRACRLRQLRRRLAHRSGCGCASQRPWLDSRPR